ncbi:FBD-associated F-box protein At4g13985-like [Silene latifolia]|uniref:FBD-associated F-box protein At4g13985-like n=1 Tax=Silene latifolia TaxID=37657 RepID=UPI003D76ED54
MVDSSERDRVEFPKSIYTSRSLEKLKLVGYQYNYMYVSKSMGFRALKELRLHQVEFSREGFNEEIFLQCPCLEILSLVSCCLASYDNSMMISASRLKTLEIVYGRLGLKPHVVIIAPMLSYFKFAGPRPMSLALSNCTSALEVIDIDIQEGLSNEGDKRKKWIIERLIDMLKEFRDAKSVIISLKTLEVLSTMPSLLQGQESPLANLKNLQLKTNWSELAPGWRFLRNKSPNVNAALHEDLNKLL